jgi:DEAD/DEAH box helicase domain-containing protein
VLVDDALGLVRACDCTAGCPACVGPVLAGDEAREHSPKATALIVLDLLAAAGPSVCPP